MRFRRSSTHKRCTRSLKPNIFENQKCGARVLQDKFENPCDKALRRGSLTYTFAWMWGYHWCEKSFLWNDFEYRKKVSFYQLMIISAKIGVDWTKCVEELKKHSLLKFTIVNLCMQLNSAWAPLGVSSPNNVEQAAHFSSHFMMLFLHVL